LERKRRKRSGIVGADRRAPIAHDLADEMADANRIRSEAEEVLASAVESARLMWQDRLVAAYALGSLAHGGFSAVSDIDVGLVLGDPLLATDRGRVANLTDSIKASNRRFADRLSVFWGSVDSLSGTSSAGRFPPLDRLDLKKYGRLLTGSDVRHKLPLPTHKELVVAGAEHALRRLATDEVVGKLKNPEALVRSDQKALTRLILFPVRFMFTARTGDVGRNDAAVEHFTATTGETASSDLARLALQWRDTGPQHSDRGTVAVIAAGVLPLYHEFLLDYERRLREYERPDLADSFNAWRQRLQA
jgi:predicted nucleotidyltransferase